MRTGTPPSPQWEGFAAEIAAIAQRPTEEVERRLRIVEDLGLDSVALAELVLVLIDDYGMASISDDLDQRTWEGVTVGQLFDEYLRDAAA